MKNQTFNIVVILMLFAVFLMNEGIDALHKEGSQPDSMLHAIKKGWQSFIKSSVQVEDSDSSGESAFSKPKIMNAELLRRIPKHMVNQVQINYRNKYGKTYSPNYS